jgi:prepilin-type N-terminal cleavage/methylation domain-containing protein
MKTPRICSKPRGFTLMELMVAMTITAIIVTVLVSITGIAVDTWNRSRAELRAARQAKAMVECMTRDFEALVTRSGNSYEWLSAVNSTDLPGEKLKSTNAAELIFFSGATDRYDGEVGTLSDKDKGGDVSCVAYRLNYQDPIRKNGTVFKTFVMNRLLVNPDSTFNDLLAKTGLVTAFANYKVQTEESQNFLCENVFQFTLTFHVDVIQTTGNTSKVVTVPVIVGQTSTGSVTQSLKIKGDGLETDVTGSSVTPAELKAGRVAAVTVSLTVLSDFGVDQLRKRTFTEAQKSEFLSKNSYQFTKVVQVPSM